MTRIGKYEVDGIIEKGGTAIVYRAHDPSLNREVALKLLREDAREHERERFMEEAQAMVDLASAHQNVVVAVHDLEKDGERLFFTMDLLAKSLAKEAPAFEGDARKAAVFMIKVAHKVEALHSSPSSWRVHGDLKPANILLDDKGEPLLADFGSSKPRGAQRLDFENRWEGTLEFMAPEQMTPGLAHPSSDVCALGKILCYLVRGGLGQTGAADVAAMGLDGHFEKVLLKAVAPNWEDRYQSAQSFAEDLQRWCDGRVPLAAHRPGVRAALAKVRHEHPVGSGLVAGTLVLLTSLMIFTVGKVRELQRELRREELTTIAWAAQGQAGVVAARLRECQDLVLEAALDPRLVAALALEGRSSVDAAWSPRDMGRFDSFTVLDARGKLLVRWPDAKKFVGVDFSFRPYIREARKLPSHGPPVTFTTGAYQSMIEEDRNVRFGVSSPVRGPDGSVRGVVLGSWKSDSVLLSLVIPDLREGGVRSRADGGRIVTVVARRVAEKGEPEPGPSDWLVLQHEEVATGTRLPITNPLLTRIAQNGSGRLRFPATAEPLIDDHFQDPKDHGTWLAGFAPVPGAPWAVIVRSRDDVVVAPGIRSLQAYWLVGFQSIFLGLVTYLAVSLLPGGRRRQRRHQRVG